MQLWQQNGADYAGYRGYIQQVKEQGFPPAPRSQELLLLRGGAQATTVQHVCHMGEPV